jgi:hypothetical protein
MKKSLLVFLMMCLLLISGIKMAAAQEKPKPKKDTVNMDTDAKPTFYYAVEDDKTGPKGPDKGKVPVLVIIGGVAVIVGVTVYFLLKKKK